MSSVHSNAHSTTSVHAQEGRPAVTVHHSEFYFTIEPVDELPIINSSITLLAAICGRKDDVDFNTKLIRMVQRYQWVYRFTVSVITPLSNVGLIFINSPVIRILLVISAVVSGLVGFVPAFVLSWDVVCLLVTRFEFWYIASASLMQSLLTIVLFPKPDLQMALVMAFLILLTSIFIDASVYMRRYVMQIFWTGVPGIILGSVAMTMRFFPGVSDFTITLGHINVHALDVLYSCAMTVATFMGAKALPSFRMNLSVEPATRIQCDLYKPLCHLVSVSKRPQTKPQMNTTVTLLDKYNVIDTRETIAPLSIVKVMRVLTRSRIFPMLGWFGLITSFSSSLWHVTISSTSSNMTPPQYSLATVGIITSFTFVTVSVLHYQRRLLRLLVLQFDMWFLSIQWTTMTLSACDCLNWDSRVLLLWSPWVWCQWTLFLDALPPSSRQAMGYQSLFPKAIMAVLVMYLMLFFYWIYFSGTSNIANDYIFNFEIFTHHFALSINSMFASSVPSVWMWMMRFLCFYPSDAFMFIRRRLEYQVISIQVSARNSIHVRPQNTGTHN